MSQEPSEPSESYLPPLPPPPPPPPDWARDYVPPQEFTWDEAWKTALLHPNDERYRALLSDPRATTGRAYMWVAVVTTLVYIVQVAVTTRMGTSPMVSPQGQEVSPGYLVVCLPFVPLLAVLGLMIVVGIQHFVASLVGGVGKFVDLVYLYAAWYAPLILVSGVLQLIPYVVLLTLPLGLYALWLNVVSVRVAHEVETGQALIAVFWWLPLVCCIWFLAFQ